MSSQNELPNPKRRLIAIAIATGKSHQEAAAEAGVNEKTVRRALKDPRFLKFVRRIQARIWESAAGRMADGVAAAVETLKALLEEGTPASVRLGAARACLEYAPKLKETVDHELRIRVLEKKLEAEDAQSEEAVGTAGEAATNA